MAMMGLCEPVWRLPTVPPQPASEAKIEQVAGGRGTAGVSRCKQRSKKSFDNKPAKYTEEHFRSFRRFQARPEQRRDPRRRARSLLQDRLARERLGEEGHSRSAFAWARIVDMSIDPARQPLLIKPRIPVKRFDVEQRRPHRSRRIQHSRRLLCR